MIILQKKGFGTKCSETPLVNVKKEFSISAF